MALCVCVCVCVCVCTREMLRESCDTRNGLGWRAFPPTHSALTATGGSVTGHSQESVHPTPPPPQHRQGLCAPPGMTHKAPEQHGWGSPESKWTRGPWGSLGGITGRRERTLEHPLDSTMRARGIALRKQHPGGEYLLLSSRTHASFLLLWALQGWSGERSCGYASRTTGASRDCKWIIHSSEGWSEEEPAREAELVPSLWWLGLRPLSECPYCQLCPQWSTHHTCRSREVASRVLTSEVPRLPPPPFSVVKLSVALGSWFKIAHDLPSLAGSNVSHDSPGKQEGERGELWAGLHQEALDCPLPLQQWQTSASEVGQRASGDTDRQVQEKTGLILCNLRRSVLSISLLWDTQSFPWYQGPLCPVLESTV